MEEEDETLTASKNGTQYSQIQCEKGVRDFSSIRTLVKAERLGQELKENHVQREDQEYMILPGIRTTYGPPNMRWDGPYGPYRCEIGNGDWRLKVNDSLSNDTITMKNKPTSKYLQVCELYTGRKNAEEWSFLPENWWHPLCGHKSSTKIIFNQNFVILNFLRRSRGIERYRPELVGTGDFLVLNLASRKQFWAWKNSIDNEIKTRVTEFDHLGRQYDFNNDDNLSREYSTPTEMIVGSEEIKIKYDMNFIYGRVIPVEYLADTQPPRVRIMPRTRLTLEADLELKLDEKKEITGYEVVNVKIHRSLIEDDHIVDDSVPRLPMTQGPINDLLYQIAERNRLLNQIAH